MVSKSREADLKNFCKKNSLPLRCVPLLQQAFIHRSYAHENQLSINNEKLEFLGDSVLSLSVTHFMFEHYPEYSEGDLTKLKATLVSGKMLSQISQELNLGPLLLIGKGEEKSLGRNNTTTLGNCLEAVLGAVYLSAGHDTVNKYIIRLFRPFMNKAVKNEIVLDFKSAAQQVFQRSFKTVPEYKVIFQSGPDHEKKFTIELRFQGRNLSKGTGSTKRAAEQEAAKNFLQDKDFADRFMHLKKEFAFPSRQKF